MAKAAVVNVKPMDVDLELPIGRNSHSGARVPDDTDSDERPETSPGGPKPPRVEKRSPTDDEGVNGQRKRHRRKNKAGDHHNKKKWKPYNQLTWQEKKKRDEKESAWAQKKRDKQFANGQPMAPYNTTQYVMEQHEPADTHTHKKGVGQGGSGSVESSDEYFYDSPDDENIFLKKEFAEAYETCHAERLQAMSKDELINDYLALEGKVEKLEQLIQNGSGSAHTTVSGAGEEAKKPSTKEQLMAEMARLKSENSKLLAENDRLKSLTAKEK